MKTLFAAVTLVCLSLSAQAEAGYKEFKFGMSVEDVRNLEPDIREADPTKNPGMHITMFQVMLSLYSAEDLKNVPVPMHKDHFLRPYVTGNGGFPRDTDTRFTFDHNRLVVVDLAFYNTDVEKALVKKYGKGYTHPDIVGHVWRDDDRFIVWEGSKYGQCVAYIDSSWLSSVLEEHVWQHNTPKAVAKKTRNLDDAGRLD